MGGKTCNTVIELILQQLMLQMKLHIFHSPFYRTFTHLIFVNQIKITRYTSRLWNFAVYSALSKFIRLKIVLLGQSCERHLDFYKRKEDQVYLLVNSLSHSAYSKTAKNRWPYLLFSPTYFYKVFIVVQSAIPHLSWLIGIYSPLSALSSKLLRVVCDESFLLRIFTKWPLAPPCCVCFHVMYVTLKLLT